MTRPHTVTVRLTEDEHALLEERCPDGVSKPEYLRGLLRDGPPTQLEDPPTRDQVLRALWSMTKSGKVAAAVSLEKALRDDGEPEQLEPATSLMDEILAEARAAGELDDD